MGGSLPQVRLAILTVALWSSFVFVASGCGDPTPSADAGAPDATRPADDGGLSGEQDGGPGASRLDGATSDADVDASPAEPCVPVPHAFGRIASSYTHRCAIRPDSTLYCWGANFSGELGNGSFEFESQPVQVPGTGWERVAVGSNITCGIRNGRPYCWGDVSDVIAGATEPALTPQALDDADGWEDLIVDWYACGIRKGELFCWGRKSLFEAPARFRVGVDSDWTRVSTKCGIRANGELHCWELPVFDGTVDMDESFKASFLPKRFDASGTWQTLSAYSGCGVRDGKLACWGERAESLSGVPDLQQVGSDDDWTAVEVLDEEICGVRACAVHCVGDIFGQEGRPAPSFTYPPKAIGLTGEIESVSVGCAWVNDELSCWGSNATGQLGDGSLNRTRPTRVGTRDDWSVVSLGDGTACGTHGGVLECWGRVTSFYDENAALEPRPVAGPTGWSVVSLGGEDFYGVAQGVPHHFRVPAAKNDAEPEPLAFDHPKAMSTISAGREHACGLTSGKAYCWGTNEFGEVGDDTTDRTNLPTEPPDPQPVMSTESWDTISAGFGHTCAIAQGALYCWGRNDSGELGIPGNSLSVPTRVGTDADWEQVACGGGSTCGIRSGRLHCWGFDPNSEVVETPTTVGSANDWTAIVVGGGTYCGLRSGRLFCWGANLFGSAGVGTWRKVPVPTRVGAKSDWSAIALGDRTTCGIRAGELYCWGDPLTLGVGPWWRTQPQSVVWPAAP